MLLVPKMPHCASTSLVCYSEQSLTRPSPRYNHSRKLSLILKPYSEPPPETHPIHRLPVEIFALIIEHTFDGVVQLPLSRTAAPWNLTQVCSSWRRLALSTPQLWTNIHFDIKSVRCLRATVEVLRRSKTLPLTISISWLPLTGYWVDGALQSILGNPAVRSRLQRLDMQMDKQVFDVIQRCFKYRSWSFPSLDDVRLSFIRGGIRQGFEVHQPVDVYFLGRHQLKSLTISRGEGLDNLAVRMTSMDTSTLEHLSLLGIKETPAGALGLLQASPELTHFAVGLHSHLGGHGPSSSEELASEVGHPNLQRMDLLVYGTKPATGLSEFLRPLGTPSLSYLKVALEKPREQESALDLSCAGFFHRSPALSTVELGGMGSADKDLVKASIPSVIVSVV